jgi:hypothetical protein
MSMDPSQQSAGLQAVLAYYKSKGVGPEQVTPDMIRQAVAANARAPGDVEANRVGLGADLGLGPVVPGLRNAGIEDANNGNTSAAPSGNVKIDPLQITSSPPRVPLPATPDAGATDPTSGSSLLQSIAPLLAGGGAAAFPLGRYILDKMRGGDVPGVAGIPGSVPMLPSPEARPLLTGPEGAPAVAGPRVGAPQLAAPGEAPPIALPNQSTGRPPIPLPDQSAPAGPRLPTTGPGFAPEIPSNPAIAPVPPTPASAAVDKAVGGDAPAPRAKVRGRAGARIRPLVR